MNSITCVFRVKSPCIFFIKHFVFIKPYYVVSVCKFLKFLISFIYFLIFYISFFFVFLFCHMHNTLNKYYCIRLFFSNSIYYFTILLSKCICCSCSNFIYSKHYINFFKFIFFKGFFYSYFFLS